MDRVLNGRTGVRSATVEAVIHHLEHGMSPTEATIQAMKEVSAPVIGIAAVLGNHDSGLHVHQRGQLLFDTMD